MYLDEILKSYTDIGGINHINGKVLPSKYQVSQLLNHIKRLLFPGYFDDSIISTKNIEKLTEETLTNAKQLLTILLDSAISSTTNKAFETNKVDHIITDFFTYIPKLRNELKKDCLAIFNGDPAAQSEEEVILAYPGFLAVSIYRIAHYFEKQLIPLIPRMMTEIAHSQTGVDIHPAAIIGESFCIDHGSGVVIGQTSIIGNNVKMYQGVTIGALSIPKKGCTQKRHPTIEDNVTIYARTTILGGNTIIGKESVIGGNLWITKSIPPHSKITQTGL